VRGLGLFWGIELVKDRGTREPLAPFNASGSAMAPINALQALAMERGLFLNAHWNVVMVNPPLTIAETELRSGLAILDDCLDLADRAMAS
jgi:taurine--2-oxoglutarate transaminase